MFSWSDTISYVCDTISYANIQYQQHIQYHKYNVATLSYILSSYINIQYCLYEIAHNVQLQTYNITRPVIDRQTTSFNDFSIEAGILLQENCVSHAMIHPVKQYCR